MRAKRAEPAQRAQRMRGVGYVRVSAEQQAQEGVSLDAQRSRLKAYCISQDLQLVESDPSYLKIAVMRIRVDLVTW